MTNPIDTSVEPYVILLDPTGHPRRLPRPDYQNLLRYLGTHLERLATYGGGPTESMVQLCRNIAVRIRGQREQTKGADPCVIGYIHIPMIYTTITTGEQTRRVVVIPFTETGAVPIKDKPGLVESLYSRILTIAEDPSFMAGPNRIVN